MASEESEVNEAQENDERIDNEIDRTYKHPFKIETFDEHRIAFDDGTEDYINLNSVHEIEIILP